MPTANPAHPGPACARLLDDEAQALAGYPVRVLVQAWLTPKPAKGLYMDPGAGALLLDLLRRWTGDLARQLSAMTMGSTLALEQVCQRTRASHHALQQLLAVVELAMASHPAAQVPLARFIPAIEIRSRVEGEGATLANRSGRAQLKQAAAVVSG